jgi:hypothetical protein
LTLPDLEIHRVFPEITDNCPVLVTSWRRLAASASLDGDWSTGSGWTPACTESQEEWTPSESAYGSMRKLRIPGGLGISSNRAGQPNPHVSCFWTSRLRLPPAGMRGPRASAEPGSEGWLSDHPAREFSRLRSCCPPLPGEGIAHTCPALGEAVGDPRRQRSTSRARGGQSMTTAPGTSAGPVAHGSARVRGPPRANHAG